MAVETRTIQLTDGRIVTGIPANLPLEDVKLKLLQRYTPEALGIKIKADPISSADDVSTEGLDASSPLLPQQLRERREKVRRQELGEQFPERAKALGEEIAENKWSYTIGAIGSVLGPYGAIAGAGIGTYLDTASKINEEIPDNEEVTLFSMEALTDAALSLGIDVTTLGIAKFSPGLKNMIKAALKKGADPKDIVQALVKDKAENFGTAASLKQAQKTIQQGTGGEASLSASQVGRKLFGNDSIDEQSERRFTDFFEGFARQGVFSRRLFIENQNKIVNFAKTNINSLFSEGGSDITSENIGRVFAGRINAAKKILNRNYGENLSSISNTLKNEKPIDSNFLVNALDDYASKNVDSIGRSTVEPSVNKFLQSLRTSYAGETISKDMATGADLLRTKKLIPATNLIEIHRRINDEAARLRVYGSRNYDPNAARQLTELSNEIKKLSMNKLKSLGDNGKKAVADFQALQVNYSKSLTDLMPEINDKFITSVGKEGYSQLARMFGDTANAEQVRAAYRSLDKAFSLISPSNKKFMKISSAEDAKNLIRKQYIEQQLSTLNNVRVNPAEFSDLARKLSDPDQASKTKEILGSGKFNALKKVVNAAATSFDEKVVSEGQLFLRSKEAAAFSPRSKSTGDIIQSALTFLTPTFLAKAALDPKKTNSFLKISKEFKKHTLRSKAANKVLKYPENLRRSAVIFINDVYENLSEAEKKQLELEISEQQGRGLSGEEQQ